VLALGLLLAAGCGGGSGGAGTAADGSCGPVTTEALDPATGIHPMRGADEPAYTTDPPTSGPYVSGMPPTGARDEPLPRPQQVAHLHHGMIMVQHRDLDADERAAVEALAADDVVVAPNPDLPERVVATAWRTKLTCGDVEVAALERFADDHAGGGPEGAGRSDHRH
jgi:hypothetical protein